MDGVSKKQKKQEEDEKKKLEEQLKVPFYIYALHFIFGINVALYLMTMMYLIWCHVFVCVVCMHPQSQSQLVWGIKDKLRKFCSVNDMKELLIANGQEVPSGESNVREPQLISFSVDLNTHCILNNKE